MSEAIMQAMNYKLSTFASSKGMLVAYENDLFTPPSGPYLRAFLLPSQTVAAAVGVSAYNTHRGHYQIDAVYPTNEGWGSCAEMAEDVRQYFKRGTKLLSDALVIEGAYTGPGWRSEGRYIIPVTVSYRAELTND